MRMQLPNTTRRAVSVLAALLVMFGSPMVRAQTPGWPADPIKLIVSYPPGSGTDTTARVLAERMSRSLGQQVIVENRPGASGRIGTLSVVRAKPDGYTLLFGTGAELTAAPITVKSLAYDPLKDLQPVMLISKSLGMVVASPEFAPNTLSELVADAKAHPGKLNYGSGGHNSIPHLLGQQFNFAAGIETTHVPYKGGGPMLIDLTSGLLQYAFSSPGASLAYVQAGKLKALAIAAPHRLPALPDVATMDEQGFPGFDNGTWFGLLAPAHTPAAIVTRLHAVLQSALAAPEVRKTLKELYIQPIASTPEEFGRFLQSETDRYRQLAAQLGIKPE
ncbi:tripartite-type tricarboxylate transporter receptor subunit TctC [Paralcaligenes ureilyticus]|uniref:Tripartite-type tricarboxylate transporter receptor subunit TctC n=2 Tax=Paralcaligenes ureilyticus TaxID=627131 RepID=A0A4R3MGS2_9BURK|nr:tripartite-type tricarboxylate transporter receptor subunit TctC [Paralcaligenes ureilyticus]